MNNRIQYIDVARGFAMLCVILGHMGYKKWNIFIFSFHMPLFFLIAGYFQKGENIVTFAKRKVRSLLVPYIFVSMCVILAAQFNNAAKIILHRDDALSAGYLLIEWSKAALLGSGSRKDFLWIQSDIAIGAIWFLLAMFFAQMVVNLLIDRKSGIVYIAVIAVAGMISSRFIWLPLSIQSGAVASIYVAAGFLYRRGRNAENIGFGTIGGGKRLDLLNRKAVVFCSGIWVLYLGVSYYTQDRLSLADAFFPFGIFDYIGSTAAVRAFEKISVNSIGQCIGKVFYDKI